MENREPELVLAGKPYVIHTSIINSAVATPPDPPIDSPKPTRQDQYPKVLVELNLRYTVDLKGVTYVDTVNENLMCPICRAVLVNPVTTPCDHTFCQQCIEDSLEHNESCPLDRSPMPRDKKLKRSPKIILNQLDGLEVKCPCCEHVVSRSTVEKHMEKYCSEALMRCPGRNSDKECPSYVKRKTSKKGCLHYPAQCPDCQLSLQQIDMEEHLEDSCPARFMDCELCKIEILRCAESEHKGKCPEVVAPCQWVEYGCQHKAKRQDLHLHDDECGFRHVGLMISLLKLEIRDLQTQVSSLTEVNDRQERRIKYLEKDDFDQLLEEPGLPGRPLQPLPQDATNSSFAYLLSLFDSQDTKLHQMMQSMTERESKQTTMLFNETIPIKNELAELRSSQQVTSMHVRWLMRFRMQENQRRFGGGGGPGSPGSSGGGGSEGGSGGDLPLPRRLSDAEARENASLLRL